MELALVAKNEVEQEASSLEPKGYVVQPAVEQAIKLYTLGKYRTQAEASAACGISEVRFNVILKKPEGQKIVEQVREALDMQFQNLFTKVVDVIGSALDHADPAIALAGANLYLRTTKGTKVNVELSAEDVVQQIMNGHYQEGK